MAATDSESNSLFLSTAPSLASSSLPTTSAAPTTADAGTNTATRASPMPYVLTAVGHSLGGAELLMYTVMQLRRREPHRLARLVLLTPAGFVAKVPIGLRPIAWVLPTIIWLFRRFTRDGLCVPFIIPTAWARRLVFGLSADIKAVPELNTLLKWVSGAH
jgi:pimeloyl-ACP methyl ester carboxylesterase